jgi:type II secretory pathway pseudopilin PulG
MIKTVKNKKINAFSFIEIGIVLLIIGTLIGAAFKGKDLLDVAKAQACSQEILSISQNIDHYQQQFHALPGDDPKADRFGADVKNGNGNHKVDSDEAPFVWVHLQKAGLIKTSEEPVSKFGGHYTIETDDHNTHWILLSNNNGEGLLTPKQAELIKSKIEGGHIESEYSSVKILNGKGQTTCLNGNNVNRSINDSVCVIKIKLQN